MAESLIRELTVKSNSLRTLVLRSMINIAKRKKCLINRSLDTLSGTFELNESYVPAIIVYAIGKEAVNRDAGVKRMLRNLEKIPYTLEFSEDFEKGWLMLSQVFIDSDAGCCRRITA